MAETKSVTPDSWWLAFPAARATCLEITADAVMKLFDDMDIASAPRQFLLVDVRRTDWEVTTAVRYLFLQTIPRRFSR